MCIVCYSRRKRRGYSSSSIRQEKWLFFPTDRESFPFLIVPLFQSGECREEEMQGKIIATLYIHLLYGRMLLRIAIWSRECGECASLSYKPSRRSIVCIVVVLVVVCASSKTKEGLSFYAEPNSILSQISLSLSPSCCLHYNGCCLLCL